MPEDTQKAWSEVNVWDIGLRNIVPFLRQKRERKKAPLCLLASGYPDALWTTAREKDPEAPSTYRETASRREKKRDVRGKLLFLSALQSRPAPCW